MGGGHRQAAEIFIDVMFMLDICISFVTCYEDQVWNAQGHWTQDDEFDLFAVAFICGVWTDSDFYVRVFVRI
jgi:hypothetical protein